MKQGLFILRRLLNLRVVGSNPGLAVRRSDVAFDRDFDDLHLGLHLDNIHINNTLHLH